VSNPTPSQINAQLTALSNAPGISIPGGDVALSSLATSAAPALGKGALISGNGSPLNPGPKNEATLDNLCGLSSSLKDISFTVPSISFTFPPLDFNLPSVPSLSLAFKVCTQAQADNVVANAASAGMTVPIAAAQESVSAKGSIAGAVAMEQQSFSSSLATMQSSQSTASSTFVSGVTGPFSVLAPDSAGFAESFESSLSTLNVCRLQGINLPIGSMGPCLAAIRNALAAAIVNTGMSNSMLSAGIPSTTVSNLSAAGGTDGIMANPAGVIDAFKSVGMNVAESDGKTLDLAKIPGAVTLEQAGQQATALTTDYGRGVGQNPDQVAFANGISNTQKQVDSLSSLVKKY